jgi:hypothetical protein
LGFEAEVDYRYQNFEKTNEEIDLHKYWETRKEEDLFIGCSKVNARKTILLQ